MSNTPEKSSDLTANAAKLAGKDLASGWNPLATLTQVAAAIGEFATLTGKKFTER